MQHALVMPRIARAVISRVPHHITQRGNRGEDVFFADADRMRYLELLSQYAPKHGLDILAYCLMSNHVHLVATPQRDDSLATTLKPVHLRYAQHVNWSQKLTGRLWQGRFFSCPLDKAHFWSAVRYVERNPVRAGIVRRAENYLWSSAATHCGLRDHRFLSNRANWTDHIDDWSAWLRQKEEPVVVEELRRQTKTGRPAGSARFVARIEKALRRTLRPKPIGRPRKR